MAIPLNGPRSRQGGGAPSRDDFSGPWPAPAKLNLFLHVIGRREDGRHRLQTVFQLLDVHDELYFRPTADGLLRLVPGPGLPPPRQNLVLRAAALLQAAAGVRHGVRVLLRKRLPVGAGLGGGSSDAATTLVALNRLWGVGWERARLAALGLCLGADVPLFVHGRSAWAEGTGEQLRALELPARHYVVIDPGCRVSTAGIYRAPNLTRTTLPLKIAQFQAGMGRNDCTLVTCGLYPEVERALQWLERFAPARMSGTGSAVFAAVSGPEQAAAVLEQLPIPWQGLACAGINESPLPAAWPAASGEELRGSSLGCSQVV